MQNQYAFREIRNRQTHKLKTETHTETEEQQTQRDQKTHKKSSGQQTVRCYETDMHTKKYDQQAHKET